MKVGEGSLPKKMTLGRILAVRGFWWRYSPGILVFLGEEVPIVGDFGVVILDWVEVAFVVHAVESVFLTAEYDR